MDSPVWSNLKSSLPVFMVSPRGRLEVQLVALLGLHADVVVHRRGDWLRLGGGDRSGFTTSDHT